MRFTPAEDEVGERVDAVAARRLDLPRAAVQRALKAGELLVNGNTVRPSHRLELADVVEGQVSRPQDRPPEAEAIPIQIRYSDERVLVISKPAGLVAHPAGGHATGTLVNALLALGEPLAGLGSDRPGIVHRLDKDTSGLLLVAKDDAARDYLQAALKRRSVERIYLALVRGVPKSPSGTIEAPIGRHPARRWLMTVTPGGRPAVTHFRMLSAGEGCSLLECRLETGRTHQIRVHLAHLGHPVLGDRTYGGISDLSRRLGLDRPFLHATRLAFPHPDDGRRIEVDDPLPPELEAALERAGVAPPR
jgi:23S rRNA pseudouridine1911/1915/1917 synthase